MAKVMDNKNREPKCPYCLENYTLPRILTSCLHTFCEKCIRKFTDKTVTGAKSQIPTQCPVCNGPYQGPGNLDDMTPWLNSLPLNPFVTSQATSKQGGMYCEPCGYRDTIQPASQFCTTCKERYCSTCADVHKSSRASKSHKIIAANTQADINTYVDAWTLFVCASHVDRPAEYHCTEHDKVLCAACAVRDHRECSGLTEIPNAEGLGESMTQSPAVDVREEMEQITTSYEILSSLAENEYDRFDRDAEEFKKNFNSMRVKINKVLDAYERKCDDKILKTKQQHKEMHQSLLLYAKRQCAAVGSSLAMLDAIEKQGNPAQTFMIRKYISSQRQQQEQVLEQLVNAQCPSKLQHTFHNKVVSLAENRIPVGTFTIDPRKSVISKPALKSVVAGKKHESSSDIC